MGNTRRRSPLRRRRRRRRRLRRKPRRPTLYEVCFVRTSQPRAVCLGRTKYQRRCPGARRTNLRIRGSHAVDTHTYARARDGFLAGGGRCGGVLLMCVLWFGWGGGEKCDWALGRGKAKKKSRRMFRQTHLVPSGAQTWIPQVSAASPFRVCPRAHASVPSVSRAREIPEPCAALVGRFFSFFLCAILFPPRAGAPHDTVANGANQ